MRSKKQFWGRMICLALALCLLSGGLVSCAGSGSEVPDGYQYATCNGEYFRLFLPTQWTVNTESGVSGGYTAVYGNTAVSMVEVPFVLVQMPAESTDESAPDESAPDESVSDDSTTEVVADTALDTDAASDTTAPAATLTDFYNAHMEEISRLAGYHFEKATDTTMNASDGGRRAAAKDITYTASVAGVSYRYRQVLCKVEGRFYLFTCSYPTAYYDGLPEETQLELVAMIEEILGNVVFHAMPYDGGEDGRKIPSVDAPEGMKLVSDNTVAYRFFAPENWIAAKGSAASQVYFSETDRSNVSVIGYVPSEGVSVADYWAETLLHYESTLPDFTLRSTTSEGQTLGGLDATVYEYTYTLGGVSYHARQTICVFSYMIVSMTYTALPEHYEAHLADAVAMQEALTFRAKVIG